MWTNMKRFSDLGIQVHLTEIDFRIRCLSGTQQQRWAVQAAKYHDIVAACYYVTNCTSISFWGVGDADSQRRWGDHLYTEEPLLFDESYNAKPAFDAVVDALNGRPVGG
jgi:endo-1,4-beta-xylanase